MKSARSLIRSGSRGFTLVEAIGVLSIMSILAAMLIPPVFDEINRANLAKESKTLESIAEALQASILRTKTIPQDQWPRIVADELAAPISSVTTSVAGHPRTLLYHPEIRFGDDFTSLPYTQNSNGCAGGPVHAKALLISSQSSIPLPVRIRNGDSVTSTEFNRIWDTQEGTIPPGWPDEWSQKGNTLRIQRINLAPLFHRLVAHDVSGNGTAQLSIDQGAPRYVPSEGLDSYYLSGSEVSLYENGALKARDLLTTQRSYIYELGSWRDQLTEGRQGRTPRFSKALDAFLNARQNPNSLGVTTPSVAAAYSRYAMIYTTWASSGFPDFDPGYGQTPLFQALSSVQQQLDAQSDGLLR